MDELGSVEKSIVGILSKDAADQESDLQKKLALRRKKRQELADKQLEMRQKQTVEMKLETEIAKTAAETGAKRQRDREALEQAIDEMKLNVPREELPFAIQRALDVKHEAELNDMLT